MAYTINLTEPQAKGLELYVANVYPNRNEPGFAEKTDEEKNQEAIDFIVSSSLESVLRSEFDRQNREKNLDEIADAV